MKSSIPATLVAALLTLSAAAFQVARAADTPASSQPTVSERLNNARDAIKAKKWQPALAELRIAVREEPKNADVHNPKSGS